jgi:hypothetical protein
MREVAAVTVVVAEPAAGKKEAYVGCMTAAAIQSNILEGFGFRPPPASDDRDDDNGFVTPEDIQAAAKGEIDWELAFRQMQQLECPGSGTPHATGRLIPKVDTCSESS